MTSLGTFEQSQVALADLLAFLREVKLTYKSLAKHSRGYADKCVKTIERARILPRPEHQPLHSALLGYVKALANAAAAQSGQFSSLHTGLKALVGVTKDTKKSMEQGIKTCSEKVKSAKKAWDRAESAKSNEQNVWVSSDPVSVLKATQVRSEVAAGAETAERGKQNYLAVIRESERLLSGYSQCVDELQSKAIQTVSQALSELIGSKPPTFHTRSPLLMLKGQNSFSGCAQWDETRPPKFSDISSISKRSISATESPKDDGNLWKLHEFLLSSESALHSHTPS